MKATGVDQLQGGFGAIAWVLVLMSAGMLLVVRSSAKRRIPVRRAASLIVAIGTAGIAAFVFVLWVL